MNCEPETFMRELYALGRKHGRELLEAEQLGYDRGLLDGRSKLSREAAAKIIGDLRAGMSLRKAAEKHGTTLSKVRTALKWAATHG